MHRGPARAWRLDKGVGWDDSYTSIAVLQNVNTHTREQAEAGAAHGDERRGGRGAAPLPSAFLKARREYVSVEIESWYIVHVHV